jgi:hypothetical protein
MTNDVQPETTAPLDDYKNRTGYAADFIDGVVVNYRITTLASFFTKKENSHS